jgi:hypothetical protein
VQPSAPCRVDAPSPDCKRHTCSYDDIDLAILGLSVLATREKASAAFRLLLEDLGHYGVARKDRDDQGVTVYLEEFSADSDGARAAIDLAERLRDAGVGVVFVVQSYEGLGDEHQAARLLGSSAVLIVHRMPSPSAQASLRNALLSTTS